MLTFSSCDQLHPDLSVPNHSLIGNVAIYLICLLLSFGLCYQFLCPKVITLSGLHFTLITFIRKIFDITNTYSSSSSGLIWTIEIIKDRVLRLPSLRTATKLMVGMKDLKILIGTTGQSRNILLFSPPLCFTVENCTT
jgi:hypothetical protein